MDDMRGRDEQYVLALCDSVLGCRSERQHRFPFLLGDGPRPAKLPVDAYYPELNLVIEYRERQHSEPVQLFDKRATISGVPRGVQRALYDQRRREVLKSKKIHFIELSFSDFECSGRKRLRRNETKDIEVIRAKLERHVVQQRTPADSPRAAREAHR